MADNGDWILKIISGPHQGVEEALPEGRLVVGTGPDCGIVLHDVLIAPQHFALTRKGAVVTVEALEGRAYCQGRRVTAATPVPAFGFVTAGTTHFVLGPAAGRWPLISPADAPELEKDPPPPAAAPAAGATATPAAATPTPPGPEGKTKDATSAAPTPAAPTPEQRRRAWWMAGLGGALLVVWLILWLLLKPVPPEPARPGPKARTERVLGSLPGGSRLRLEERGDQLMVSGYLDSDAAHRDLIAALRAEVPEATLRLWSTPRLVETARAFLATRRLNLTLTPGENGELTIAGTAPTAPEWAVARQMLLAEVPGLQRIIDEVTVPKETVKGAKPSPESLVSPDKTFTIVALQTLSDAPAWVRLANGAVYFAGGRFQGIATFTGLEGAKARFEHPGGASLFGLGDDLATLLPTPAAKPGPARLEPASAPAAKLAPAKSAVATPPSAPASANLPRATTTSQPPPTTTLARPVELTPAPVATAAVPAATTPAPAAVASQTPAHSEPAPAPVAPSIASAPAPEPAVPTPAPAATATVPGPEAPVPVATVPTPVAPTSEPSGSAPTPALPAPAATAGVQAAPAPVPAPLPTDVPAPAAPVATQSQTAEAAPAPAIASAPAPEPAAPTPAPTATATAPGPEAPASLVAAQAESSAATTPANPAPVTTGATTPVPVVATTEAAAPAAPVQPEAAPASAPATAQAVAGLPAPAAEAPTTAPEPLAPLPAEYVKNPTEAKIRLISDALQARDAGDLSAAQRALSLLARLLPNDGAVLRLRADIEARILAQSPVRPAPAL